MGDGAKGLIIALYIGYGMMALGVVGILIGIGMIIGACW